MSDVTSVRRQQQDDLNDLQAEYARKRKRMTQENEAEVEDLRQSQEHRKESLEGEGEAAINHIRKAQTKEVETAEDQRRHTEERARNELGKIEEVYKKKVTDAVKSREELVGSSREKTHEALQKMETESADRLSRMREKETQLYARTKASADTKFRDLEREHNEKLTNLRTQSTAEETRESERGRSELAKIHAENDETAAHLHRQSQEVLTRDQQNLDTRHKRMEQEFERQFNQQKSTWTDRENRLDQEFTGKIDNKKEAYDAQLKLQQKHFESIYKKNDGANQKSMAIQRMNAAKELNELKKNFLRETDKYEGKKDDPFYKVVDRGTRLLEGPSFYFVEAYVPEHEKDNVRVTLDRDHVVVQGQRAFQDKLESDGKNISSSTYQSFREDLPLEKPIVTEGMSRERDGDWIRLTIPKLTGFSRKV